MTQIKLLSSDL